MTKIIKVQRGTNEINRLRTTNQTLRIEKNNLIKCVERKNKEIERLKTELQDTKEHLGEYLHEQEEENKRLNNIIKESAEEILNELEENHHLSYGVALSIRQKLLDYKELKGGINNG